MISRGFRAARWWGWHSPWRPSPRQPAFADAKCGQDYYDGLRSYDAGNKKAAIEIWTRAALVRRCPLAIPLGEVYENGDKVLINYVEAHKWYNLAANNDLQQCSGDFGSKEARQARDHSREARDRLEDVMTNRAITDAQATSSTSMNARSIPRVRSIELARIYQKGSGLPQSSIDACRFYAVAAAKNGPGSNEAKDALDVLNQVLTPASNRQLPARGLALEPSDCGCLRASTGRRRVQGRRARCRRPIGRRL